MYAWWMISDCQPCALQPSEVNESINETYKLQSTRIMQTRKNEEAISGLRYGYVCSMHSFPLYGLRPCPCVFSSSDAVRYGCECDGGAGGVARGGRRRGGACHSGGQLRRRRRLAPQLQVPEVPDHVGLADLLRVHVCLAPQHPENRGHVGPALSDVLRAQ